MTNSELRQLINAEINRLYYLNEDDFNQSFDNRVLKSYVEDIEGGDNFADYCSYIFKLYEEEGYYD